MKNTQKYLILLAVTGLFATTIPITVNAQKVLQERFKNAETNRDLRNAEMKRLAETRGIASSTRQFTTNQKMATSTPRLIKPVFPNWFNATTSPWRNEIGRPFATSSTMLPGKLARFATSTELKNRANLKELRMDQFAWLHNNLLKQVNHALTGIKDVRTRVVNRITIAEQNGRNMTEARRLLGIADEKIVFAEQAINELANFVPPAISATNNSVTIATPVILEKPRVIGKKALDAIKDAEKSLRDVIREIAKSMGLKIGQNDDLIKNATTTP